MAKSFQKSGEISGGEFISRFTEAGAITVAATGIILTLTPPAGQRVRLTQLVGSANMTSLTTVTVGVAAVVASKTLVNSTTAQLVSSTVFSISGALSIPPILGEADEAIVLTTNVATSHIIYYAYEFGE